MISNPYRGHSPTSARDRRPVVTMRFSPPSQLRPQPVGGDVPRNKVPNETNVDLYMPYRVQAAGKKNALVNSLECRVYVQSTVCLLEV